MTSNLQKSLIALIILSLLFVMQYYSFSGGETEGNVEKPEDVVTRTAGSAERFQVKHSELKIQTYNLTSNDATFFTLPPILREISGLAVSSGSIWTHNDEDGILFNIDIANGTEISSFIITENGAEVKDDLEGIAVAEEYMYVINSSGKIYKFKSMDDGESAGCKVFFTNLGSDWEIEGLVYNSSIRSLVIVSKKPLSEKFDGKIGLFFWSIDSEALQHDKTIYMSARDFASRIGKKKFRPSGIEWDAVSGNYLLVAARQRSLAEINSQGELLHIQRLEKKLHPQMEGIAILPGKGLLVSDEGGDSAGRLTLYPLK